MDDIENISQEEFNYLLENPGELKIFMNSPVNAQMLTNEQLEQALNIIQGLQ
ncbi:hypothetical protein ACLI1A_11675 [Flavobacterium sp. RHBU_3]|uniref:hypothetical protein n=1 Tax=Flavobacterium sp. RHBU_3 TaxID=3391184 RepID=UPI003984FE38